MFLTAMVCLRGQVYYEQLLKMLGDKYAPVAMAALAYYEIQRKLDFFSCRRKAKTVLEIIKQSIVNSRLAECLDFFLDTIEKAGKCVFDSRFKKLSTNYISWK